MSWNLTRKSVIFKYVILFIGISIMIESLLNPTKDLELYIPKISQIHRERTTHIGSSLVQWEGQLVPKWTPELQQHLKKMLDLSDDELRLIQKQIETGNIQRNTHQGDKISFAIIWLPELLRRKAGSFWVSMSE